MFFCEYCEIFRSSFFTEHLPRWQLLNTEQKNPARKIHTSTTQYPIDHHAIIKLIKNRDWKYESLVLVFPSIKYSKFQLLNKYQKEIYQVCFPGTFWTFLEIYLVEHLELFLLLIGWLNMRKLTILHALKSIEIH